MLLPAENFWSAREFLWSHARPLERGLFVYHYDGGRPGAAHIALTAMQNPDGGFGNGIEPDFEMPDSSAIGTVRGLQALIQVQTPADHPLVRGAVRYFLDTYNAKLAAWEIVPQAVNNHPHAPWWHYDEAGQADKWGGYVVNPRAEILACLHRYASLVPPAFLRELSESVLNHAETSEIANMHDIACYLELLEEPAVPEQFRDRLLAVLRPALLKAMERNPAKWGKYCLKPAGHMGAVRSPTSPLYPDFEREVEQHLDYEIAQQQPDGSWLPTWSWGDAYPEAWNRAKLAWQGILTVAMLKTLRAFGRLG